MSSQYNVEKYFILSRTVKNTGHFLAAVFSCRLHDSEEEFIQKGYGLIFR